jgi:Tol biopolymer transport system component
MRTQLAAQRLQVTTATALVGAALLLGACTSPSVRPTPGPSPRSALPLDIASLRVAPAVTDLAGRFAYGAADGHIWTIDIATGVRTEVTHGTDGADFDPHWSPDGSMLVFRTERFRPPDPTRTGYNGIFVINADGSAEHPVNPPGGGLFPEWSPENLIVFSSPRPDGSEGLFSVRPDGSGLRDLRTYAEHVTWSLDGTETLVDRNDTVGRGQDWNIWRASGRFTDLTRLTTTPGDDHFGGWSPDASMIAFSTTRTDEGDVWLMQRDGTDQSPFVTGPGAQSAEAWLPDGRILVADYQTIEPAWYLLDRNGSNIRSVPQLTGLQGPVDWITARPRRTE